MERVVKAYFGLKKIKKDPSFELEYAQYLRENLTPGSGLPFMTVLSQEKPPSIH
jgi:hypothetical protein